MGAALCPQPQGPALLVRGPRCAGRKGLSRQQYVVDDVDDAVGLVDVGNGDEGGAAGFVIDIDMAAAYFGGEGVAADGLHVVAAAMGPETSI